ncbi:hypothetical protein IAR55_005619 [Kwoniella newhampshirensis]|uniref:DUF1295-domain-containing protein n=1 Tax=Kwoniella newhampshirensis TaxID=1651941 RepID=A0AAW0YV82_9TREE
MVYSSYLDVGVLRDTLLPNLGFQLSLAVPTYLLGRSQNFFAAKDFLWSSGQVASAWYAAIGRHVLALPGIAGGGRGGGDVSFSTAVKAITRPGWLLLAGATLWGGRLLFRVIQQALNRGKDDPRYDDVKKDPQGWNKAFFTVYVPEAITQALITLPFTAPFRTSLPVIVPPSPTAKSYLQFAAVGLFTTGFVLELLADYQLAQHQEQKKMGMLREGVWSIVRHPNYLGDILVHSSFPLLLYANNLFNPYTLLGPITNWFFLRHFSGDKENEANQATRYQRENPAKKAEFDQYRKEKNAVWPAVNELVTNRWSWIVLGAGALGAVVERITASLF